MRSFCKDTGRNLASGARLLLLRKVRREDFALSLDQFVLFLLIASAVESAIRLSMKSGDLAVDSVLPSALVLATLLLLFYATAMRLGLRRTAMERAIVFLAALPSLLAIALLYFLLLSLVAGLLDAYWDMDLETIVQLPVWVGLALVLVLFAVAFHRSGRCIYRYVKPPGFTFGRLVSGPVLIILIVFPVTFSLVEWAQKLQQDVARRDEPIVAMAEDKDLPANAIARNRVQGIQYRQGRIMSDRMDEIAEERPGTTDLYFIGFAGWAEEDVFRREVTHVRELMDERFGTRGRSILLINSPQTVQTIPLANSDALEWALWWYDDKMNFEEDILFLYLTSHGSKTSLAVRFKPFVFNYMPPWQLKRILDRVGVKHRVIVVSACYSGIFVEGLKDENTLVITAAHHEKTSFGCANGRDYTYFGDAYFNQALRDGDDFIKAFEKARTLVAEKERGLGLEPSEPQIHVGANIAEKLRGLPVRRAAVSAGP